MIKYLNFENISKKRIRVPWPLEMYDRFSGIINFDPVKEILKTGCHIYILMKEVIILGK